MHQTPQKTTTTTTTTKKQYTHLVLVFYIKSVFKKKTAKSAARFLKSAEMHSKKIKKRKNA